MQLHQWVVLSSFWQNKITQFHLNITALKFWEMAKRFYFERKHSLTFTQVAHLGTDFPP
jgi:hypothetical protein